MRASICSSCRVHLHARLRRRVALLESTRRPLHQTVPLPEIDRLLIADHNPSIPTSDSGSGDWGATPPSAVQLASAAAFFRGHPPRKLWTATEWRKQNQPLDGSLIPEVAFLGRSNVGKSSLLNALLGSPDLNHVGSRPGKTTTMHAWGLAASDPRTGGAIRGHNGDTSTKLTLIDMPGYGFASHKDWGNMITAYLKRRKHLRRVFVLLDAMHGVKDNDKQILDLLRHEGIAHQIVASKCDRLDEKRSPTLTTMLSTIRQVVQPRTGRGALGEILTVGGLGDGRKNKHVREQDMMGIANVQWAVLVAAGLPGFGTKASPPRAHEPQGCSHPREPSILPSPPRPQHPTTTSSSTSSTPAPLPRRVGSEPAPHILPPAPDAFALPERVVRIRSRHAAMEAHHAIQAQARHAPEPGRPASDGATTLGTQPWTRAGKRPLRRARTPPPVRRPAPQSPARGSKATPTKKPVGTRKEEQGRRDTLFLESHLV